MAEWYSIWYNFLENGKVGDPCSSTHCSPFLHRCILERVCFYMKEREQLLTLAGEFGRGNLI
jgi:hypothetical protein